jgi:hypothetical protein
METTKKTDKRLRRMRILKVCILTLVVVVIYILASIPFLSEYVFARGITRGIGWVMNRLTNYIPVSFYEWTAVILIVGGITLLVFLIVLLCRKRFARAGLCLYRILLVVLCVALAFGVLYSPLYDRKGAMNALGLAEVAVTEENLYSAAEYYVERLNAASAELERDKDGNIVPMHTFAELSKILNEEFNRLDSDYFAGYEVRPKKVVLSVPMSYLGITGIYFPFYAEANVNVNIPVNELPTTMAHEMAHAKGVSRENEANIVSYVLCIRADDVYLNYSGLMRAVTNLLNSLPTEKARTLREKLAPDILREYGNGNEHYEKYEGVIDRISSWFNNLFLKANGVPGGTKSYGETTSSLVALYEQLKNS